MLGKTITDHLSLILDCYCIHPELVHRHWLYIMVLLSHFFNSTIQQKWIGKKIGIMFNTCTTILSVNCEIDDCERQLTVEESNWKVISIW